MSDKHDKPRDWELGDSESFVREYGSKPVEAPAPAQPTGCTHTDVRNGLCMDCGKRPAQPVVAATPCNCCADLALAAAEFADSTRVDNHEEAKRHRQRYIDILVKHATTHVAPKDRV